VAQRNEDDQPIDVQPVHDVSGSGQRHTAVAHGGQVVLKGKTTATFDGGSFHTEGLSTEAGSGCKKCKAKDCVHVTGKVVTDYHVTTSVSLPSMAQFAKLTPCQRERVRQAIQDQLAPHEQDHVTAFKQYNGSSEQPIDVSTCRAAFSATVQSMVRTEEKQRRASAQAASDALDPFQIDVDLDCSDDSDTSP
jgi:hypothetical protein